MTRLFAVLAPLCLTLACGSKPAETSAGEATPASQPAAAPAGETAGEAATGAPAADAAPAPVPDELPEVVARVNGTAILGRRVEAIFTHLAGQVGGKVSPEQRARVVRSLIDQLVRQDLLRGEAEARQVKVGDADVATRVKEIRAEIEGAQQTYEAFLTAQGLTDDEFREQTRASLAVAQMLQQEIEPQLKVTAEEVEGFYKENPAHFTQGEAVRASHILVRVEQGADAVAKSAARAQAAELLEQLKSGADFAALAKQHSQDPGSAARGGDLGFFGKGQMVPAFEQAAFALDPGQTSELVETPFGFHIIRVAERRPSAVAPLDAVRDQIQAYLTQQLREKLVADFVAKIRQKSKIEILI